MSIIINQITVKMSNLDNKPIKKLFTEVTDQVRSRVVFPIDFYVVAALFYNQRSCPLLVIGKNADPACIYIRKTYITGNY